MTRKYTTLPDLGRCTIGLRGYSSNGKCRVSIVQQTASGRILLLMSEGRSRTITEVTSLSTDALLKLLSRFEWASFAEDEAEKTNAQS